MLFKGFPFVIKRPIYLYFSFKLISLLYIKEKLNTKKIYRNNGEIKISINAATNKTITEIIIR